MKLTLEERTALAKLVGRFMRAMHRHDAGRMLPLVHRADLTLAQLAVLDFVQVPRTVSAVAENAGLSRPATSQMIDKLVRRGWVGRTEGVADRRQRALMLSGRGRVLMEKVHAARAERFEASLRVLSVSAARRLSAALQEATAELDATGAAQTGNAGAMKIPLRVQRAATAGVRTGRASRASVTRSAAWRSTSPSAAKLPVMH